MYLKGEYIKGNEKLEIIMCNDKKSKYVEIILVQNKIVNSAYKKDGDEEYSFSNKKAKDIWGILANGLRSCTAKNGISTPFILGASVRHEFAKSKMEFYIETYNGDICMANVTGEDFSIYLEYNKEGDEKDIPENIPYIKLTKASSDFDIVDGDKVYVRPISEIALDKKDISWLKNKKYYIVNDDEQAEKIFEFLDNYNGVIAYDTETTGLKINCFGKINSKYMRELDKWNNENPEDQIRADRLVGVIFCIEEDVSYYFPVFNRRFKNLYEDRDSQVRNKLIRCIKYRYTEGDLKHKQGDMAEFIKNTSDDEIPSDVILMERLRNILETKHIVPHAGSFEWKVGWQYEIDTNIRDDTMILHQIMYKFRGTTSNRGEPSKLEYLSQREFGVEQWGLKDFFPDFEDDDKGVVRGGGKRKRKKNKIDFSYMDYEGTRIYAPTDGDMTFKLFLKYKKEMMEKYKEQEYIYNVEVIVACAVAYMEFYGHRLNEGKIEAVKNKTRAEMLMLESELRQIIQYSDEKEIEAYNELKNLIENINNNTLEKINMDGKDEKDCLVEYTDNLDNAIRSNTFYEINLASPKQVAKLFYDDLGIEYKGDKKSVAEKAIKPLLKAKTEDGKNKYPVVHKYAEYKKVNTLLTKFFDNLQDFMYPGGIIFTSFGQISTATGRMSARQPNCQQYPDGVCEIVCPRDGYAMLDVDYSQIEYRVLVALSGEDHLAKLFEDPDNDYHTLMASLMYGVPYASVTPSMRGDAKSFNFGIPYGMGFKSLAILLTGMSGPSQIEEAKEKYELYFKDQPRVRKFFNQVKEMASVNKYTKTFWNRYRYYSFIGKDGNINEFARSAALRQAGNAVIQGTAADIFKIGVARTFLYIRNNKLFGKVLITNMIHDEVLYELDLKELNMQRVLKDIKECMSFKVNGFPPLFVGAGFGYNWYDSKEKMTIHPHLLDELSMEAENMPILRDKNDSREVKLEDIVEYFGKRIYEFRKNKIKNYILDEENQGKDLHPVIGNLINMQFTYGHNKKKEGLSDEEFTKLCLREFIKQNGLNVDPGLFKTKSGHTVDKEDVEYTDGDEDDLMEFDDDIIDTSFALIDESNELYGSSIQDLIRIFGFVVSKSLKVCGVDITKLNYKQRDNLIDFLDSYVCDEGEEGTDGTMQIVLLQDANILTNTGIWVKGIDGSELETRIKMGAVK